MNQKKAKQLRKLAKLVTPTYKQLKKQYNALPQDKYGKTKKPV